MLTADMNMSATDRAFQDGPEAVQGVGVRFASHVFPLFVLHDQVPISFPRKRHIRVPFVGRDGGTFLDLGDDFGNERIAPCVRNDSGNHVPTALDHPKDGSFDFTVLKLAPLAVLARLTADVGFVGFDMPAKHRVAVNLRHVFADFMAHAPSCLVRHAQLALQFLGRNAVPRGRKKVHRVEPLLQRRPRVLERRSRHRMNMVPAIAGVGGHLAKAAKLADLAALWAGYFRAEPRFEQVFKASTIIRELAEKVLNRWHFRHGYLPIYI